MEKRKHIMLDGPGVNMDGGLLIRSNNLRKWVSFDNGAAKVNWNGENEVAKLGYDPSVSPGYRDYGAVKSATFTTARNVGPTASAICSEVHLESNPSCNNISDNFYWPWDGVNRNPVALGGSNFSSGGGAYPAGTFNGNDNSPKPSMLQMFIGIYFEYDGPNHPDGSGREGVFETGIGGGDLVFIENLTSGGITWLFTDANEFANGVMVQSTSWCDGTGAARPYVVWMQMLAAESDVFRISVVPPGWGHGQAGADIQFSPDGLRYYIAVYVVEGCSLLGGGLIPGDLLGKWDDPVIDGLDNQVDASGGGLSM